MVQPVIHTSIAIVTRFHGGGGGIHGPVWLVVPIVVVGVAFRLWQYFRRRR